MPTPTTVDTQHRLALQARKQQQVELRLALDALRKKWAAKA